MLSILIDKILGSRAPRQQRGRPSRPVASERIDWQAVPPLSKLGLDFMESRAASAHPVQLRRWIAEIDQQLGLMSEDDREHARALCLKFEHLSSRHAAASWPRTH